MTEIYITSEGFKKLEEKLTHLKSATRSEIASRIEQARSYGDLSENAEYKTAKEEQSELEAEIANIEVQIANAKIISKNDIKTDCVSIGSVVEVLDVEYDEKIKYTISGVLESDPSKNIISNASPVGRALMGKKKGEKAIAHTPTGKLEFKILSIK